MKKNLIDKYLGESQFPIGQGASYKSLNDAKPYQPGLAKGPTEIWYTKHTAMRDMGMGLDFLLKHAPKKIPSEKTLKKTHVLLGKIKETNPHKIFRAMQGEMWSPAGEARDLIKSKGLKHTSMMVGDIIRIKGKLYMVGMGMDFDELSGKPVVDPEDYKNLWMKL